MSEAKEMPQIKIIYEDDAVMVVNKPSGIIVNRSDTTVHEKTLQDWTENKLQIAKPELNATRDEDYTSDEYYQKTFIDRGGIVHRLDKETSGALIVAKNWQSFKELQRQFKERLTKKRYLALVHGKVAPPEGEINVPVDRLPWNRKQFGVIAGGREAVTFYKTVHVYSDKNSGELLSLLELEPKTGRTHQIRVHVKYLDHPIFADFLYGGRKVAIQDRLMVSRVFLHASEITFHSPKDGNEINVQVHLPDELQDFLNTLSYLAN